MIAVEMDGRIILSLLPEIALVTAAILVTVGAAFVPAATGWTALGGVSFLVSGVLLFRQYGPPDMDASSMVMGPLAVDAIAGTWRWVALACGLLLLFMLARPVARNRCGESVGMLMMMIAGVMLAVGSANLVVIFLSLELISIPTYVMLFLGRNGPRATEAAAKYFFLSVLSSIFFLMGLALLFGMTGSLELEGIHRALAREASLEALARPALLALVMIFGGLGFKIAAVPFHFYAPDVYLATTNLNAGLLSVVPKIAGVIVMVRLLPALSPVFPEFNYRFVIIISLLTMTIGNVGALLQNNFRRMMAFSSIAHAGYLLIGVSVGLCSRGPNLAYDGFAAAQLYLLAYVVASIGAFAVLCEISTDEEQTGSIAELRGLSRRRPWLAGIIATCMFSLAGLPPLAGFWGKLALFSSVLTAYQHVEHAEWFLILAIVGILNAAMAAAYYLRVIGTVYFSEGSSEPAAQPAGMATISAMVCGIAVVAAGLIPGQFVQHFERTNSIQDVTIREQSFGTSPATPTEPTEERKSDKVAYHSFAEPD